MIRRFIVPGLVALAFLAGLIAPRLPTAFSAQADSRYFPETQHYVKGLFLKYWTEHGGLAQQGYPLTEEFVETSKLDPSKSYTVQYFERAVFERHPENAGTAFEVLLSQLGKYELDSRYPNNSQPAAAPVAGPTGPPPPTPVPAAIIGQQVTYKGLFGQGTFQGTVTDVKEITQLPAGSIYPAQTTQGKFVAVFIHATNTGTATATVGYELKLRDSRGRTYDAADTKVLRNAGEFYQTNIWDEVVQPGLATDYVMVYETPADATGYLLVP